MPWPFILPLFTYSCRVEVFSETELSGVRGSRQVAGKGAPGFGKWHHASGKGSESPLSDKREKGGAGGVCGFWSL
jgi:hypothetical protein